MRTIGRTLQVSPPVAGAGLLAMAVLLAAPLARRYGRAPAARFAAASGASIAGQQALVALALRRQVRSGGTGRLSIVDLMTLARGLTAAVLLGLLASGVRDRGGLAGWTGWLSLCGGSIACDWLDGPIARRLGPVTLVATGAHEGPLREAIHRLKYGNEPGLAAELGGLIASRLASDLARGAQVDALVPVRLHRSRERSRGYDQACSLAAVAGALTGVPVRPAIHRLRSGPAQATLGRMERQANVRGVFVGIAAALRGLRVALIDDVATTGATLLDAAAAARACGAREVRAYVVAFEE